MLMSCRFLKKAPIITLFSLFLPIIFDLPPSISAADYPVLSNHIAEYNLDIHRKSLENDSYRGEEGILLIRPDIARSLGIKAYMDQDYQDSMLLFEKADKSLNRAKTAMASRIKKKKPGEYSKKILESFLSYRGQKDAAKEKLLTYRDRISKDNDERLDEDICYGIIEKILQEGLKKYNGRLRDGLGYFYNQCQGINNSVFPLTHKNVKFVNHIFRAFIQNSSKGTKGSFSLDMEYEHTDKAGHPDWKKLAGEDIAQIAGDLEHVLSNLADNSRSIDPLLFIALMKRESSFDPNAVSYVGAAGLTQIMPRTAIDMGMKNIQIPAYFDEATKALKEERKIRRQAIQSLFMIKSKNDMKYAEEARKLMQRSLTLKKEKERLFARYRKQLRETNDDDRFKPVLAMKYGYKYFAKMMEKQNGDISLALASYNAGPHRVIEYKGIPPFEETVTFRNQVLKHYREYLEKTD